MTYGPELPRIATLAEGIRRVLAPNPSMMTGPGTNTYLFGMSEVAVVDPGPDVAAHIERILALAAGAIRWVLVTHTHPDHSPAAMPLAVRAGAELLGIAAPDGAHQDATFRPDRILGDGDVLAAGEFELQALHTPGHASNHLCYRHAGSNWLVTGDHVIDGSTVVIDPPDGNMKHYIESLRRVKSLNCSALLPGHGARIDDPTRAIDWIIDHRLEREAMVLAALQRDPGRTSHDYVPQVYAHIPRQVHGLAERSLLAHLLKLRDDGLASEEGGRWRAIG